MCRSHRLPCCQRSREGFTLIELLVVIAIIAILAAMLLPVLSKTKCKGQGILCMNNTHQLMLAVHLYSGENQEYFPMNVHGAVAQSGATIGSPGAYYPWITGWLTWDTSPHNTNSLYLTSDSYSVLARYSGRAQKLYKCPADNRVSAVQAQRGWTERVRSISMNSAVGKGNKLATDSLLNCEKIFEKTTDVNRPSPANLWVFVDEHPDSINDGAFFNAQKNYEWDRSARQPALRRLRLRLCRWTFGNPQVALERDQIQGDLPGSRPPTRLSSGSRFSLDHRADLVPTVINRKVVVAPGKWNGEPENVR